MKFFDYDNDGELDLIDSLGTPVTWQEPLLLFHNDGRKFVDVSAQAGATFREKFAARGLAVGDFDNDGALDVLIAVNDAAPLLLRNRAAQSSHWLGVKLVGKKSNPDATGARVTYQAGDLKRSRMKVGGGSFLSSHDPRMVLGIGARRKMDWLEVKWPEPGGAVERISNLPIDRYITIVEGEGKWR